MQLVYFSGMFPLAKAPCVGVLDLDFPLFNDVSRVLDGFYEPLTLLQFELNAGSTQGCEHLLHFF